MDSERTIRHRGGCQCGAVRYELLAEPFDPQICHCRMCQRAFGSYFAPLASIAVADLSWARGRPALFPSSTAAERGFCVRCGTPLTFQYLAEPHEISIALGSLDEPARVKPGMQYGIESRIAWLDELHRLPARSTEDSTPAEFLATIQSLQLPAGEP